MTLKITRIREESPRPKVRIDRRLYRTHDGRLVEHGHPDAAFLFCSAGKEVDAAEFDALKLDVPDETEAEEVRRGEPPKSEGESDGGGDEEKQDEPKGDKRRKAKTEDK